MYIKIKKLESFEVISQGTPLKDLAKNFDKVEYCVFVVDDSGEYIGIIGRKELVNGADTTAGKACNKNANIIVTNDSDEKYVSEKAIAIFKANDAMRYIPLVSSDKKIMRIIVKDRVNDVASNVMVWGENYIWEKRGEEWSVAWGSSKAQWDASILPRISNCLPAENILEIAPGYGRWTKFLIPLCENYIGVDLNESCINACKEIFKEYKRSSFYANDGKSLPMVKDNSVDFIFSFDSLVHVEMKELDSYISEFIRVLKKDGFVFIHHSNTGAFLPHEAGYKVAANHWRATDVSANKVYNCIKKYGGTPILQECLNWGEKEMIDCFTLFTVSENFYDFKCMNNDKFMDETANIRNVINNYTVFPSNIG